MKISKRAIKMLSFVTAVAGCVSVANATVNYTIGNGGLGTFSGQIDGNTFQNALAGGIKITEQGAPQNDVPASYVSVCTDLEGTLYLGQTYTYNSPVSFSDATPATGLDPTWGAVNGPGINVISANNASQAIQNAAYLFYTYGTSGATLTGNAGISGTVDQLEALQLAVWSALYNTMDDGTVSGSRFTFSGVDQTVMNDVNTWLTGLTGNYNYSGYLFQPTSNVSNNLNADGEVPQELLYGVVPPLTPSIPSAVPEAPTIVAGALLILPFAASAFKIIRRKRTL